MERMEEWVQETFAPLVLASATPEVERLARKNGGISFASLLTGFAALEHADAPLRSVSHQLVLADFGFRFVAAADFATRALPDATRALGDAVARHPPHGAAIDLQLPPVASAADVPVYLQPLPWYRAFRRVLFDSFCGEELSLLGQPAAMLLAVSSTDSNPRHSFEELAAARHLPPPFLQGLYDPNVPKFYVVVHDVVEADGTAIDPDAILMGLQLPPQASAVLRLNSLAPARANPQNAAIWATHALVRHPLVAPHFQAAAAAGATDLLGGLLSPDDLVRVGAFVREFGLRFVLGALEARIFQLNEVVSAMKKGVRNVFKSWLRKPKDLSTRAAVPAPVTYRCDSIEAQTRLLADTAFMVRDYELALQTYRLVRDDYKADKSTLHGANANEMIALCLLLTKGSPMQMTNALETATAIYVKGNSPATARLAVRAAVLAGELYATLSHSGLFTDYMDSASAALIRGSTMEQGICSAVLMERAALCDLQARQPKFRKFGFRMVMAGHVYDALGHKPHSARCYSLARAVFDGSGWFQVEDHINFTLAQQANRLSDPIASINLFLKLIGTGRNSASQQEALLYEFGLIVKEFLATDSDAAAAALPRAGPLLVRDEVRGTRTLLVRDLRMPELDDKSTVVFAPGNAVGINREIDGNPADADAWKALEQTIDKQNQVHQYARAEDAAGAGAGASAAGSSRWLHQPTTFNVTLRNKKNQLKRPENYALGETIYVEFVMKNALSCAVDVEDIHLFGKFEPATPLAGGGDVVDVPEPLHQVGDDAARVTVDRVNLQLLPCSEERVRLAVTPRARGVLRLTGVRWSICGGDVHGEHAFDIPGPLLQDTRANREARARAPNTSLIANVIGAMPWLGVQLENAPSEAYAGEIVRIDVTLANSGSAGLTGLQLCCSDLVLCVASARPGATTFSEYVGASGQVLDLSDVTLAPGETRKIVMWARGARPGRLRARFVFRYRKADEELAAGGATGAASAATPSLSRSVRLALDLNFLPCVSVSYSVAPSFGVSGEYVLGVTVQNERRDGNVDHQDPVQLEQLTCVSNAWTIERFARAPSGGAGAAAVRDASQLGFREASTSYFRVVPRGVGAAAAFDASVHSCSLQLSSHESPTDAVALEGLPVEQFLCVENARELVREAGLAGSDGPGADGKRGGGFRTIQSVRRENKALKNQQSADEPADAAARRRADPQPTSKAALLHSPDVDGHLVLVWSTENSVRRRAIGQSNVTPIKVRSPLRQSACPLTVTLQYADTVSLRAPGNSDGAPAAPGLRFAELDILMTIRNDCSASSSPLDFTLEMLHPGEGKSVGGGGAGGRGSFPFLGGAIGAASPHFFWAGVTKKTVTDLAPSAVETVKLRACFMSSGVYDLNRFRLLLHPPRSASTPALKAPQPTVLEFPVEYLVYVKPPPSVVMPSAALLSCVGVGASELLA
ncbi:hypothetical protein PybrP1_005867 [[Pythium] brassicae (nom. inval.)]|nr:hypothetical protein PybrP1_005867 [[Pythium] brassicae (nom. inval.)]